MSESCYVPGQLSFDGSEVRPPTPAPKRSHRKAPTEGFGETKLSQKCQQLRDLVDPTAPASRTARILRYRPEDGPEYLCVMHAMAHGYTGRLTKHKAKVGRL